jgi:outer membrane receptor protein involved in Fe transport
MPTSTAAESPPETTSDAEPASTSADSEEKEKEEEEESLTVETVAPTTQSTDEPRHPSGWATRVDPDGSFGKGEDLGDALAGVSGVSVRRSSSLGQPAFASVRGGNPRQMTVLLNGIRVGAPVGIGFDIGGLSTSWIDEVDIHRGAAATTWGSGALTGAMNLRTHPPDEEGWRGETTAMGGSFGTLGFQGGASGTVETVAAEVDASWRGSKGDFGFVDEQNTFHRRTNNAHRQVSVAGSGRADLNGTTLESALVYENLSRGAPGPSEFQEQYDRAHVDSNRTIATLGADHRTLASGAWGVLDLHADAGYVRRRLSYTNPDAFMGGGSFESDALQQAGSAVTRLSGFFEAGHIAHLTVEGRTEHYRSTASVGAGSGLSADRQTLGVGLSDEWLLLEDRLSLIGGLRTELVAGRRGLEVPVMPAAGVVWRALPWMDVKTNVGVSHRTPDFDELYLQTETVRGNPDLQPERATNWDLGVHFHPSDFPLSGRLTGFFSDIRRTILFLPQTAYRIAAENLEGARAGGLEARAALSFEPRFRLGAAYTWTEAHLTESPGTQLPHRPRHRAHLSSRAEFAGLGPLEALHSLELTAAADVRSRVNLGNFGNLTNPPFWRLDLGLAVAPTPTVAFGLQARNVTNNTKGADSLQRPLPGRAFFASFTVGDERPTPSNPEVSP